MIDEIKSKFTIYDILQRYGIQIQRNGMIICPFHADKNASVKIYDNNTFHCFGCGADGDVVDFVKLMEKCDTKTACELINGDKFEHYVRANTNIQNRAKIDFKAYLTACHNNLHLTDYFAKRGINKETQNRFLLGYDKKYKSVTIPYNRQLTYYQSRSVIEKKFYKPSSDIAGSEPLFNEKALGYYDKVFVVESPICAISIMQLGYPAIAICGVQGWKKISKTKTELLIALDNDEAGRETAIKIKNAIGGEIVNISDEYKDPNELLLENRDRLLKNLQKVY